MLLSSLSALYNEVAKLSKLLDPDDGDHSAVTSLHICQTGRSHIPKTAFFTHTAVSTLNITVFVTVSV